MVEAGSSSGAPTLWYLGWRISHQNSFATGNISKIFDNLLRGGYVMAHDPPPTYTEEEINHPMYCRYHAMLLHPTDRCLIVRDWIETLIQRGKIDSEGKQLSRNSSKVTICTLQISRPLRLTNRDGPDGSYRRRNLQPILKARQKKFRGNLLDKRRGLDDIKSHLLMSKLQEVGAWGSTPKIHFQIRSLARCTTTMVASNMGVLGPPPNKAAGPGPSQSPHSLPGGKMKTISYSKESYVRSSPQVQLGISLTKGTVPLKESYTSSSSRPSLLTPKRHNTTPDATDPTLTCFTTKALHAINTDT
ncbi:hypothetical protein Taro_032741 [Colocasia esculenta]|uniref:Uncharacterized protein n=1 Tax=Colocasia esculenta TaxID=4460 RepID=A0A843W4U6_COLES|nr:hypothetical protein [Colocasia esculenta]